MRHRRGHDPEDHDDDPEGTDDDPSWAGRPWSWENVDPVDPGAGMAVTHPETRSAVRRRLGTYVGGLVVGVTAAVLFLVLAVQGVDHGDALRNDGIQVPGTITATSGGSGGSVDVRYTTGGTELSGHVTLDDVARDYRVGETVAVHADPADPSVMTIDDQDNQGAWSVRIMITMLFIGLFVTPITAAATVRWVRAGWVLRRRPFEQTTVVRISTGTPFGRRKELSVHLICDGAPVHLHRSVVMPPSFWREVSSLAEVPPGPAWVARSGRRVVLARPGGASPWVLVTPRTDARARAWAARDTPV